MPPTNPANSEIARVMEQVADLLEAQEANPFRVNAFRRGAAQLRSLEQPVAEIARAGGEEALQKIPNIGQGLSQLIMEYVHTGFSTFLQRLQGQVTPEELFAQIPGIGEELAERIVEQLHLHSLEELEQAAHDGRLAQVEGFGEKRIHAVRQTLAAMLSGYAQRSARRRTAPEPAENFEPPEPPLKLLLAIDEDYRKKAEAGRLKKIAPRRFNPGGEAWLPVYHTEVNGWDFSALFSNTKRAHDLGKTRDWVVIYFEKERRKGQHTVVTETHGPLEGRRVVRGREKECREYYLEV